MDSAAVPARSDEADAVPAADDLELAGLEPADPELDDLGPVDPGPYVEPPRRGTLRRFLTLGRHALGLVAGAAVDAARVRPRGPRSWPSRLLAFLLRPWLDRELRGRPFAVQLRRRCERLGPAYVELGQLLAMRRDLLPPAVGDELARLHERLPALDFGRFRELVAAGLGHPTDELFAWIESRPTENASIAQSHRAATVDGESVIVKVIKPGIRQTLERDARVLRGLGRLLGLFLPRYRPRRVIDELLTHVLRAVDLGREAENVEILAANFRHQPAVVFPRVHHRLSSAGVLTTEQVAGMRPDSEAAGRLEPIERARIVELGAVAVLDMIFRDGFFHVDPRPGNLRVLKGPRVGFVDPSTVGRLSDELRRALLYYFYSLVNGDARGTARYLTRIAEPARGADLEAFRHAVEETTARGHRVRRGEEVSIARLVLAGLDLGAEHRLRFPVEMALMAKALVAFEETGESLVPGFDAVATCRPHVTSIVMQQWSPQRLGEAALRGAPELLDAAVKLPLVISEGLRLLEHTARRPATNPFAGIRGTIFGGFCIVAGAVLAAAEGPWLLSVLLFVAGLAAALDRRG